MGVTFKTIWRALHNGNDYFASNHYEEARQYPPVEQLYYIPYRLRSPVNGIRLYRFYDSDGVQHTESSQGHLPGSKKESILGVAWPQVSAPGGTEEMYQLRDLNQLSAIAVPKAPAAGFEEKVPLTGLYAYPRYGYQEKTLECISGSSIKLCSDKAAGGSIAELVWNNYNFIKDDGYSHNIQSSILGDHAKPTEGGSTFNKDESEKVAWNGAPLISLISNNNRQSSSAIPIDRTSRRPRLARGVTGVIYPDLKIGKNLQIDAEEFKQNEALSLYASQIIVYDAQVTMPTDWSGTKLVILEVPGGSIPTKSKWPSHFYTVDALYSDPTKSVREIFNSDFQYEGESDDYKYLFQAGGGIAIATGREEHAIAVYSRRSQQGKEGEFYGHLHKKGVHGHWSLRYAGPLYAGQNTFRAYIILGEIEEVHKIMHLLYTEGY
ncbi:hypothetical protein EOPP23_09635 [Endozoicomonas sp. OPT23]|nr:hypothetical protein [Endozoicomonas sp. OPT23]